MEESESGARLLLALLRYICIYLLFAPIAFPSLCTCYVKYGLFLVNETPRIHGISVATLNEYYTPGAWEV